MRLAIAIALMLLGAPAWAAPRVGVVGGIQSTWVQSTYMTDSSHPKEESTRSGFGGLSLELPLARGFSFGTGLEYQPFVDRREAFTTFAVYSPTDTTFVTGRTAIETRAHTIVVPLRIDWARHGVRVGIGPQARFVVSARQRLTASLGGVVPVAPNASPRRAAPAGARANIFESVRSGEWFDATDAFLFCSVQPLFLLGADLPMQAHRLRLEGRWATSGTALYWRQPHEEAPSTLQASLGFLW